MSAMSSESPQSADLNKDKARGAAPGTGESAGHEHSADGAASKDFGPNEWLVDELYQRYLADPGSVDMAWWNFFADYTPPASARGGDRRPAATAANGTTTANGPAPPAGPGRRRPGRGPARRTRGQPARHGRARPGPAGRAARRRPAPAAPAPPAAPGTGGPAPAPDGTVRLRGAAARTASNMAASLSVPTATSVRTVPAKLLIDNRIVINNHLARGRGGKVSFTHLIGYAVIRALAGVPEMNNSYTEVDGKPALVHPEHVNLGLAIDVTAKDGSRQLLVPAVKAAETLDFRQFWMAYEDVVRRARTGKLTVDDYAGTTISLTNPGTIGTEHSVPRLVAGQGCIVGVGAMEYPAAYQGAAEETMTRLAISKSVTLTSTYDHRIIQGAQSGEFLRQIHLLLLGEQRLLGRGLQGADDPLRAGPLGPGHPGRPRGRHHQVGPGARAHPRLPGARAPDGRHRPAGVPAAQASRPGHQPARADPVGPGADLRHRWVRRQAADEAARDPGRAA